MYRKDKKEDYYTSKAHQEGYPARSVYKLKEIDEKFRIFKKEMRVLDLGASPGSWLLYLSLKVERVLGVDLNDLKIKLPANVSFLRADIERTRVSFLKRIVPSFDVVVSDMAPSTSGVPLADIGRSMDLAYKAFEIALLVLRNKGIFITKVFEGGGLSDFVKEIKTRFEIVKIYRPKAVTKGSRECYLIAKNYKLDLKNMPQEHFNYEEAKEIGEKLKIDWSKFDVDQFRRGMDIELEHGLKDPETNITGDDPLLTGKIALAHLNEMPDYYDRLEKMEEGTN